jgi:hypothetical protein
MTQLSLSAFDDDPEATIERIQQRADAALDHGPEQVTLPGVDE